MAQVLYRKYRSKNFQEIKGQDYIVSILTESVLSSNVSHGYLFCGPRGTGKTSLARLLAKAVNCENFEAKKDVCNECPFCTMINDGESMDIIEMDAASNRGIEEIRNMRDTVNYMPSVLKKKVYIIDEAHMLTKEAFNALLKTLEEPPEHVIFIMATTEPHKLPITILSRVQRYDLRLASEKDLTEKITAIISQESREIDNKSTEIIYRKSGGSFRDAESILGKILSSTTKKKITEKEVYEALGIIEDEYIEDFINALLVKNAKESLLLLNKMYDKTGSVNNIIDQTIEQIRERVVNNITSVDKGIYNLANLFINLKINSRDFNDKLALMEIEIINLCGLFAPEVAVQQPSVKAVSGSKAEVVEVIVEESEPVGDVKTLEDLLSHIAVDSKSKYPRLKSILESSTVNSKDGAIVIANKHKFNIIYLERKDVKSYILDKAKLIEVTSVTFVIDGDLEEKVSKKVDKEPEVKVEKPKVVAKESKAEVKEEIQKPKELEHLDNTALVENLL